MAAAVFLVIGNPVLNSFIPIYCCSSCGNPALEGVSFRWFFLDCKQLMYILTPIKRVPYLYAVRYIYRSIVRMKGGQNYVICKKNIFLSIFSFVFRYCTYYRRPSYIFSLYKCYTHNFEPYSRKRQQPKVINM